MGNSQPAFETAGLLCNERSRWEFRVYAVLGRLKAELRTVPPPPIHASSESTCHVRIAGALAALAEAVSGNLTESRQEHGGGIPENVPRRGRIGASADRPDFPARPSAGTKTYSHKGMKPQR
jgi:hypothetical protein